MLHHIKLSEPRLVEWIAGRMYDVTQSILLRQHEHRVQKALHSVGGLDEHRPSPNKKQQSQHTENAFTWTVCAQFMSLVEEDDL